MESGEDVLVIARSPEAYQKEHLPGAINISHRKMSAEMTKHLGKTNLVVIYCDGIGCNASTKGALNMSKLLSCQKNSSVAWIGGKGIDIKQKAMWREIQ